MPDPSDRPHASQDQVPAQETSGQPLPGPVETQMAVQQLREAGFSADQQAALTTALLRVLALWTQQATRGDLHAEQQALAQQLDALHDDIRREVRQHAEGVRAELRDALAQHADVLHATRIEPPHRREVLLWLITALLFLTTVGVVMLVIHSVVSP